MFCSCCPSGDHPSRVSDAESPGPPASDPSTCCCCCCCSPLKVSYFSAVYTLTASLLGLLLTLYLRYEYRHSEYGTWSASRDPLPANVAADSQSSAAGLEDTRTFFLVSGAVLNALMSVAATALLWGLVNRTTALLLPWILITFTSIAFTTCALIIFVVMPKLSIIRSSTSADGETISDGVLIFVGSQLVLLTYCCLMVTVTYVTRTSQEDRTARVTRQEDTYRRGNHVTRHYAWSNNTQHFDPAARPPPKGIFKMANGNPRTYDINGRNKDHRKKVRISASA